ncbi:C-lysozyme inhibitor [Salmonella enterica subsp. houtenae]|uniref:C-lysozyme inhibitor n=14 Tax=Salmonella enterica TaxID=28901 RepID=A0A702LE60_SALHO|nr:Ivy family C-type lysozyme inhibitor [Salmonella enterica]EAA7389899.1 C-lysozyme inhibitor [Salmonella enterica subsp. enterica]EAU5131487.1 C-lysozyme inhibitor [Salmonella enterica subsp. enterica serovar Oranienburg]EBH8097251.1 C-lysozyme inhibitor [Salmonella enterica subsp. houtenae serovar O:11:g,z25:-]EBI0040838.1 C-lysozyme inhibitor [Salmonella enterica subsp. diarizonae serovar 61:k:z35]EBI0351780.1 C-lysozyme inhibitor [Salmonella enterica subsp. arizonae serovar 48:z4,z23,z32:
MKKTLIALFLSFSGLATSAYAQDELTISKLAVDQDTKAEFQKMAANQHLPKWVTQGGTDSQGQKVNIAGNQYLVLTSCKPHDCSSQRIAVLYATATKKIAGVFSSVEEKTGNEKLQWLNLPDDLSIDGKTVLFAALTGSLDNHPDSFNFK